MEEAKVLVVEDEAILILDISQSLELMGYSVIGTAAKGEDALKFLAHGAKPDIVLMDIHLKGELDGIETAEEIKRLYQIPFIYLTAYSDERTLERAKKTEPYGYINKTYNREDLKSSIEMALYRHKTERALVENEHILSTTLESINVAVITTDSKNYITYSNTTAHSLFSAFQEKEQGERLHIEELGFQLLNREHEEVPLLYRHKEKLVLHMKGEGFLRRRGNLKVLAVDFEINAIMNSSEMPSGYVYVIRDKEQEREAEILKYRLASIVENSEDAIISVTPKGEIKSWNNGARTIFGYTEDEVVGKNISLLTPDYYPNEMPEILDRLNRGENVKYYETIRQSREGNILQISLKPSPILDRRGRIEGVSIIARDVTERKELERELLEIDDNERQRIGQDLHDSLGQQLTGISLKLKALTMELRKTACSQSALHAETINGLVKNAIMQTRELARGLIPMKLLTEGIFEALSDQCESFKKLYDVSIDLDYDENVILESSSQENQLYRISQEAVTNAIRHGEATAITIKLENVQREVVMTVIDNGKGIGQQENVGLGLKIMHWRASLINANLSIRKNPQGSGTIVKCRIPIQTAGSSK